MVAKICDDAVKLALDETIKKCSATDDDCVLSHLKDSDSCYHGYFRFYLVRHIAKCLAAQITGLKTIYIYGSTMDDTAQATSDINLILHVKKKEKKNQSLMDEVNKVLTKTYVDLLELECAADFKLLDVQWVSDNDIKLGTSAAGMLRSVHNPPMVLWKRGEGVCELAPINDTEPSKSSRRGSK